MPRVLTFVLLTVCHFVLTFVTLLTAGGIIMSAFDGEGSGTGGMALLRFHQVLTLPIGRLGPAIGFGQFPIEHMFLLLNSMLWAALIMTLWRVVARRRKAPTPTPKAAG